MSSRPSGQSLRVLGVHVRFEDVGAERLLVGLVDLQALLLKKSTSLGLTLESDLVERLLEVRRALLDLGLLVRVRLFHLLSEIEMQVVGDQVVGQDDLVGHLVELHLLVGRQRIVLTVDRAGLQGGVDLGEGDRRRIGAERLADELPALAAGHAQLHASQVGRRHDLLVAFEVELARADIGVRQNLDLAPCPGCRSAGRRGRRNPTLCACDRSRIEIGGAEDAAFRHLVVEIVDGEVRHVEIAALHGGELGALLEQRRPVIGLEVELIAEAVAEGLSQLAVRMSFSGTVSE